MDPHVTHFFFLFSVGEFRGANPIKVLILLNCNEKVTFSRGRGGGAYQVLNDSNFWWPNNSSAFQGQYICGTVSLNPIRIIKGVDFCLDPTLVEKPPTTLPNARQRFLVDAKREICIK